MTLRDIQKKFASGALSKAEYINAMYEVHSLLFQYADFLNSTDISAINISDNSVVMTYRNSDIRFICIENDKRLAPLDAINFGSYERDELAMQLRLIENNFSVFDIGANLGWFALHVAKYNRTVKVFSFEPIPNTFKFLNENIKRNSLGNINTFNFGFSDKTGEVSFFYDAELSVNASLTNVSENRSISEIKCRVTTLDEFSAQENMSIDFIKCDVEGAELLAFKGGIQSIRKNLPVIYCEMLRKWTARFNYHPNDIIDFFGSFGYGCFIIKDNKLEKFFRVNESTAETNYFFLHAEKHKEKIKSLSV
jgi:FkbM family methyltransferase